MFTISTYWFGPTSPFGSGGETSKGLSALERPSKFATVPPIRGPPATRVDDWTAPSPVNPWSRKTGPRSGGSEWAPRTAGACRASTRSGLDTSNATAFVVRGLSAVRAGAPAQALAEARIPTTTSTDAIHATGFPVRPSMMHPLPGPAPPADPCPQSFRIAPAPANARSREPFGGRISGPLPGTDRRMASIATGTEEGNHAQGRKGRRDVVATGEGQGGSPGFLGAAPGDLAGHRAQP